jgi:hypothetical protein
MTNKDFKLSKSTKRTLALLSGEKQHHWKRMMISAEEAEKKAKMAKYKERNTTNQGEAT